MRHLQTKVGHLHTKGHGERYVGSLFRVDEPVPDDLKSQQPVWCTAYCHCFMLHILYKKTKSCRGTHSRKRRGRNCCCKGKTFIWIVQGFWKKSAEMEATFNRCWVLEIQNAAFTNQSGAATHHGSQVEQSEGVSPSPSHRTVRESLPSHDSSHSTLCAQT